MTVAQSHTCTWTTSKINMTVHRSFKYFIIRFKVQRAYHVDNDGRKIFDMEPKKIYEVVKNKKINI